MRILFLGDIVGKPGRKALKRQLSSLRKELRIDLCVANGENSAGGSGITPSTGQEIFQSGVDVITTGDHIWRQKDARKYLTENNCVLRPANLPDDSPGNGYTVVDVGGVSVAVINLQGRTFMPPIDCPFRAVDRIIGSLGDVSVILVDMHAEATSDKIAMGRYLDGRASAVFGTHTHVQTADEQIFPGGTAFICDVGMVGPYESILGRKIESVVASFTTQLPNRFEIAENDLRLGGAMVDVDSSSGKALSIERLMKCDTDEAV